MDSSNTYLEHTSLCDGSSATVLANVYCVIPLASLYSAPVSLPLDAPILTKVKAYNARGWSLVSDSSTTSVLSQTVPSAVGTLTTDAAQTGEAQVFVQWPALSTSAETGGSAITSYNLQWDAGNNGGPWVSLQGDSPASLATSILLTSSIVGGTTYRFQVRASNIHGWGAYSATLAIKAAQVPYQITSATYTIDPATGGFALGWDAPADGSDTIDRYLIQIKNGAGSWVSNPPGCVGTEATIVSTRTCIVAMSELTSPSSFNLAFDVLIEVRLQAGNSYGLG
jgi:hypothetical protein